MAMARSANAGSGKPAAVEHRDGGGLGSAHELETLVTVNGFDWA